MRRHPLYSKLRLLFASLIFLLVLAEIAVRVFWHQTFSVPFFEPDQILYAHYPGLQRITAEQPSHDDEFYDVLILAGSVLYSHFGQVEPELVEQLALNGQRNVRVFNLASPAHTTRDSWLKYSSLGDARFELVVFYHGINDARANNAPPEIFRENYDHFAWYNVVNTMAPYHGDASFALPMTIDWLATLIEHVQTQDQFVPTHHPRQDWVHHGRVFRSVGSFKNNLGAISDLADQRGDPLLVMTFATYLPDDYSFEAFREKRLQDGLTLSPIELWGERENVLGAVSAHNEVVRSIAARREEILFVDQANLMAGNPSLFKDVCHFTPAGSSRFAEQILKVLLPNLPGG